MLTEEAPRPAKVDTATAQDVVMGAQPPLGVEPALCRLAGLRLWGQRPPPRGVQGLLEGDPSVRLKQQE